MSGKVVYKNKWISVTNEKNFYTIDENTDQVTILPIIDHDKLLLVKQYRPAIKKYTLEFPGGGINRNEKPKNGAIRELFEETGIAILNKKKLLELPTVSINPQRNRKYPKIYYFNASKNEIPKKINDIPSNKLMTDTKSASDLFIPTENIMTGILNRITIILPIEKFALFNKFIEAEIEPKLDKINDPITKVINKI